MDTILDLVLAVFSFFSSIIVAMPSIKERRPVQGVVNKSPPSLGLNDALAFEDEDSFTPRAWFMMVLTRMDVPPPLPPKPTRKHGSTAQAKPSLSPPQVPSSRSPRLHHASPPQLFASPPSSKRTRPPVNHDPAAPFTRGKLELLLDPFKLPSEVLATPLGRSRRRQYFGLGSADEVRIEEEDITAPIPPIPTSRDGQLDRQRLADSLRYGAHAKDMEEYRRLMSRSPPPSCRNSTQTMNHSRFLRTMSGEVMSVPSVLVTTSGQDTARHPKGMRALSAFRPVGAIPQPTSQLARVSSGVLYSTPLTLFPIHSPPPSYKHRPSRASSLL